MRTLSATSLAIVIANILAHTSPAGAQATFPERVRNCEGQACVLQWPRLCPPAPPVSQLCTTFDPPLLVGTQYGYSAGNPPGSVVFSSGGADASVELFELFSGVTTFGETKVDKPPLPFGSSQVLDINNINRVQIGPCPSARIARNSRRICTQDPDHA